MEQENRVYTHFWGEKNLMTSVVKYSLSVVTALAFTCVLVWAQGTADQRGR
jgi:hypothetical protein